MRNEKAEDFLLEIGCEELPADYLPEAMRQLQLKAEARFGREHGFDAKTVEVWATPRRLVVIVHNLAPVVYWEKIGPAKAAAYDAQGRPTPAALGFAKSQGVAVSSLIFTETPKGPCVVAQHTAPVVPKLAEAIPALMASLRFPKQMRWEASGATFARPIRWLVALYGSRVVTCRVAGVTSGRKTVALRRTKTFWATIPSAAEYLTVIRRAGIGLERLYPPLEFSPKVLPDRDPHPPKATALRRQLEAAARKAGGRLDAGEEFEWLLTTTTFLAEAPVVASGSFRKEYLALPPEILATAMAKYLKAFSVRDTQGRLLPRFLVVLEGRPTQPKTVLANYERILETRFADAQFFWRDDMKTALEAKLPLLKSVVFHQRLGTLDDKMVRMLTLMEHLGVTKAPLAQAIQLAKADLVTQLVKEFPTLQGIVGAEYARQAGASSEVVQALREQYSPRTASDPVPASPTGAWLSVLDRVDTLTGYFGVGLAPTSSEDPYGLRRQALGLVRILIERNLSLSLRQVLRKSFDVWGASGTCVPTPQGFSDLENFLGDRFRWWCLEQGYSHEMIGAVLDAYAASDNMADMMARLRILSGLWKDPRQRAAVLFPAGKVVERTWRIVRSTKADGEVNPARFTTSEERALWQRWKEIEPKVMAKIEQQDYVDATTIYGTLYPQIHVFFDKVFVMDENPDIRRNRLAMLREINTLYAARVADLSKLPLPAEL